MPRLASPATESPAMAPTASGRNSGSSTVSAAKRDEQAVAGDRDDEVGPAATAAGADTLTAMARMIGTTASTARPARLRRRPKMSPQLGAQEPAAASAPGPGRLGPLARGAD